MLNIHSESVKADKPKADNLLDVPQCIENLHAHMPFSQQSDRGKDRGLYRSDQSDSDSGWGGDEGVGGSQERGQRELAAVAAAAAAGDGHVSRPPAPYKPMTPRTEVRKRMSGGG